MIYLIFRYQLLLFFFLLIWSQINKNSYKNNILNGIFEIYRSISCLYFSSNSLIIILNNISDYHPYLTKELLLYKYNHNNYYNQVLFLNYILLDLVYYLFCCKKIRYDLVLHHILCLYGLKILWNTSQIINYLLLLEIFSSMNFLKYIFNIEFIDLFIYYWKAFIIIFIRFPIHFHYTINYIHYFSDPLIQKFSAIYFLIYFLDIYWLSKIYIKLVN